MSASQSTPRPNQELRWEILRDPVIFHNEANSKDWVAVTDALTSARAERDTATSALADKCSAHYVELEAELAALREEKAARADEDELTDAISKMMGDLLTQTANALKGEPPPLTLHDWSDLPVKVAALRERHDQAVVAVRQLMDDYSSMIDSEWGWSEPEKNADPDTHQSSGYILGRRVLAAETAAEKQ